MQKSIGLLYFGRLEPEKGFDMIIASLNLLLEKQKKLPFRVFIFGDGSLKKQLLKLTDKSYQIHYFGWRSLSIIKRYKDNCQYLLMPSKCLETFGLSALTASQRGLSVIGYAKGGQKQFISSNLNITQQKGKTDIEKLYTLLNLLPNLPITKPKISGNTYSKRKRIQHMKEIFGEQKKILIINDFIQGKGGIENYLQDSKKTLEKEGYEIIYLGKKNNPKNIFSKYFYMIQSIANIPAYIKTKRIIKTFNPDIIRFNNIFRYQSRLSIFACKNNKAKKIMMYHDLGYFFPYPSKLEQEEQILFPTSPKNFYTSTPSKNIIKKVAGFFKGLRLYPLQKNIKKQVDIHIVPSKFMEKIVQEGYTIPKEKIQTIPHFINEEVK